MMIVLVVPEIGIRTADPDKISVVQSNSMPDFSCPFSFVYVNLLIAKKARFTPLKNRLAHTPTMRKISRLETFIKKQGP